MTWHERWKQIENGGRKQKKSPVITFKAYITTILNLKKKHV